MTSTVSLQVLEAGVDDARHLGGGAHGLGAAPVARRGGGAVGEAQGQGLDEAGAGVATAVVRLRQRVRAGRPLHRTEREFD